MTIREIAAADERHHPATRDPWWGESWGFEFGAPDAALGGFVQFTVYPRRNIAWFWAAVVGEGRSYVLCRDEDVLPPIDPDVLEIRSVSLWSHAICETPLEHWTVAMEAYAVEMDDPYEAWRGERGDRIGLAFDLEWESMATSAVSTRSSSDVFRYELPCSVNGVLQLGDETFTLAHEGWRHHAWGRMDWSDTMLHGVRANGMGGRPRSEWYDRSLAAPASEASSLHSVGAAPLPGDWALARSGTAAGVAEISTNRRPTAFAPFVVTRPDGSQVRILRTFERVVSDGASAPGWSEAHR